MLDPGEYKRASKTIAHALRHAPDQYALKLDIEGWASLDALLDVLRQRRLAWQALTVHDLIDMLAASEKKRYEIDLDQRRVRAYYGHSIDVPIQYQPAEPPEILYHGTTAQALDAIRKSGLQPMSRQRVHLSEDRETAQTVGSRHPGSTIILTVRARDAHRAGVHFYTGNESV
jgi:putative RNA 2'-phosphotransferase